MPETPEIEYAFWTVPGTSFTVTYSLPAFQEIEFVVSEGYRRIPHGGVEVGGLLFGKIGENSARAEAFRSIQCEHASGPSFVLSDRDLDSLRAQLNATGSDADLAGLDVLGWFISHTRSPLQMNEREKELFDEFFPEVGSLTVLIKPERFKPTRFAFLFRGNGGLVAPDANQPAMILPSPGRSREGESAIPSIQMPAERPRPPAIVEQEKLTREYPTGRSRPESPPRAPAENSLPAPPQPRLPEQLPLPSIERVEVTGPSAYRREPVTRHTPATGSEILPSIDEIRSRRPDRTQNPLPFEPRSAHHEITRKVKERKKASNARLATVLLSAAALGCGVGYWSYLQLPPPVIPLAAQTRPNSLLITWPAEQTRDARSLFLRVNDGEPVPVPEANKDAGQLQIPSKNGNTKIELISQHWWRESRGILRYVQAVKAAPAQAPTPAAQAPSRTPLEVR